MEIRFLGTCACDYSPKLKTEFKDKFDADARRSSCVLINKGILVDCGEHTLDSMRIAGVKKEDITDIVITHLHDDHFNEKNIESIAASCVRKLRLWVRDDAVLPEMNGVEIMRMQRKVAYELSEGVFVTGLIANHDETTFPQHLYFEREGKSFFYGCDGAWLVYDTFTWLYRKKITLFVFDGTCGDYSGDFRMAEHNSIPMIRLMLPSLKTVDAITDDTLIFISHIAPSLHKTHKETTELLKNDKINVAYDDETVII